LKDLFAALGTPALATDFSPAVVAAAGGAIQHAYEKGIQYVAYASLAFGIVGIIACACCKDVDSKMDNKVIKAVLILVGLKTNFLDTDRSLSREYAICGSE
jgi:hypothetical protein